MAAAISCIFALPAGALSTWRLVKALDTLVADDGHTPTIDGWFENVAPLTARQKEIVAEGLKGSSDAEAKAAVPMQKVARLEQRVKQLVEMVAAQGASSRAPAQEEASSSGGDDAAAEAAMAMTIIVEPTRAVTGGVDTPLDVHVAAVLDEIEASLREEADIPARLTADSMTIAIDVATNRLPDAAALLRELGLI